MSLEGINTDPWYDMGNDKPLAHPLIREQKRTCLACPEQYEGTLQDGRFFYFRYRFGTARLSVGLTQDNAIWAGSPYRRHHPQPAYSKYAVLEIGDDLQGIFDNNEQRDQVFAKLMQQIMGE